MYQQKQMNVPDVNVERLSYIQLHTCHHTYTEKLAQIEAEMRRREIVGLNRGVVADDSEETEEEVRKKEPRICGAF